MKIFKGIILTGLVLGFGSPSHAVESPKIKLDLRIDVISEHNKTTDDGTTTIDQNSDYFKVTTSKVNLSGKVNDKVTYRLRYNFNKDHVKKSDEIDNTNSGLDYLYLRYKFSDDLYLQLGKYEMLGGSIEASYSSMNLYHFSRTNDAIPVANQTGARMSYKFNNHELLIDLMNGVQNSKRQTGSDFAKGVQWNGSFSNGKIEPIISYAAYPRNPRTQEGVKDDTVTTTQWSIGTRLKHEDLVFELETGSVETPEYKSHDENGTLNTNPSVKDSNIVFLTRYLHDQKQYRPFVKLSIDNQSKAGKEFTHTQGLSFGAEYYPQGEDFRIHAAAVTMTDDFSVDDASELKVNQTKYLVGMATKW